MRNQKLFNVVVLDKSAVQNGLDPTDIKDCVLEDEETI